MKYFCLNKTSYVRMYENIGYILNEQTYEDIVFDESGAVFLSEITREPKHIQTAATNIASKFVDTKLEDVQNDLCDFLLELEASGFVTIGQTIDELKAKEPVFSYSNDAPTNTLSELFDESYARSSDALKQHFWKNPRLFDVQIELTSFCNLQCIHCYLGDNHPSSGLTKDEVFSILDQLKSMGTLQVSFTGGEIFSRSDLPEILYYARRNDFSITLLTNNTLLTDSLVDCIKESGVRLVKVSVYSMKPEIHDAITGQLGSWKKTIENIEKLVNCNVPVQISCPIMKENLDSFTQVIEWGKVMRFNVKTDLLLTARADFTKDNLVHRLNLDESAQAIKNIIAVDEEYQKRMSLEFGSNNLRHPDDHICGVGTSTMCIGANGDCYPCPAFLKKSGNIHDDTIQEIWKNSPLMNELRNVKYSAFTKCQTCPSSNFCPICMGKFFSESGGDMYMTCDYLCGVSHLNRELVEAFLKPKVKKNATFWESSKRKNFSEEDGFPSLP